MNACVHAQNTLLCHSGAHNNASSTQSWLIVKGEQEGLGTHIVASIDCSDSVSVAIGPDPGLILVPVLRPTWQNTHQHNLGLGRVPMNVLHRLGHSARIEDCQSSCDASDDEDDASDKTSMFRCCFHPSQQSTCLWQLLQVVQAGTLWPCVPWHGMKEEMHKEAHTC